MIAPWPLVLQDVLRAGPCVSVTIACIKGSAPRELGARMLVGQSGFHGSIGGGNLEHRGLEAARSLLSRGREGLQESERIGLGPSLNQCCGGAVTLLYEYCEPPGAAWLAAAARALNDGRPAALVSTIDSPTTRKWLFEAGRAEGLPRDVARAIAVCGRRSKAAVTLQTPAGRYLFEQLPAPRLALYLFGAGHVGRAVERVLRGLPFTIHWVDSRRSEFPAELGIDVRLHETGDAVAVVAAAPPDSLYLVMTHSHQLDEDICHAVLRRRDFRWLGLIGSATKAQRFRHRLAARGIPPAILERLECPVGLPSVGGKRPATIAVSIAAKLLADQVPDGWR